MPVFELFVLVIRALLFRRAFCFLLCRDGVLLRYYLWHSEPAYSFCSACSSCPFLGSCAIVYKWPAARPPPCSSCREAAAGRSIFVFFWSIAKTELRQFCFWSFSVNWTNSLRSCVFSLHAPFSLELFLHVLLAYVDCWKSIYLLIYVVHVAVAAEISTFKLFSLFVCSNAAFQELGSVDKIYELFVGYFDYWILTKWDLFNLCWFIWSCCIIQYTVFVILKFECVSWKRKYFYSHVWIDVSRSWK